MSGSGPLELKADHLMGWTSGIAVLPSAWTHRGFMGIQNGSLNYTHAIWLTPLNIATNLISAALAAVAAGVQLVASLIFLGLGPIHTTWEDGKLAARKAIGGCLFTAVFILPICLVRIFLPTTCGTNFRTPQTADLFA